MEMTEIEQKLEKANFYKKLLKEDLVGMVISEEDYGQQLVLEDIKADLKKYFLMKLEELFGPSKPKPSQALSVTNNETQPQVEQANPEDNTQYREIKLPNGMTSRVSVGGQVLPANFVPKSLQEIADDNASLSSATAEKAGRSGLIGGILSKIG